ncbi:hypothetical protein EBS57_06250, partial [bacterium]|nr:hypothetical protein [bacterium]
NERANDRRLVGTWGAEVAGGEKAVSDLSRKSGAATKSPESRASSAEALNMGRGGSTTRAQLGGGKAVS